MADVPIVNLPTLPEYDPNDYLIVEDISGGETCKTRISTIIETNSVISVNGMQGDVIITPDDLDDSNTNNKFLTVAQSDKIDLIRTDLPADYFLNGQGIYVDMSGSGTGDMLKSVYDPDNISANAFDYNNFINKPGIPAYLNDLSDVDTTGALSNQALMFDGATWKATTISTGGDMTKAVYDPTGKNRDAFDYNNFDNTPTIPSTTDDITEGSNLYYTDARVETVISNKTTDDITEGSTNLYYTDTRVDTRISSTSINSLNDVDTTGAANADVLQYDGSVWKPATISTGGGDMYKSTYDPNGINSDAFDYNNFINTPTIPPELNTTDDLAEGTTNLYYTDTRVSNNTDVSNNTSARHTHTNISALDNVVDMGDGSKFLADDGTYKTVDTTGGPSTTDDLPEGTTNLYYTDTRVSNNNDVSNNTSARHTHTNKAILDATQESFTTTLKNKLDGIQDGAEVNVNADWNATSGDALILNKPVVPSVISDMTDVDTTGASSDQVLQFDGATWRAETIGLGIGDMEKSVYDPTNKNTDAFNYNNFYNTPVVPSVISDMTDVDTTGATTNQLLRYDGSKWIADDELSTIQHATIKDISSNYTVSDNDANCILECTNAITITLPDGLEDGTEIVIINAGTDIVTVNATTSLSGKGSQITTQWSSCMVYHKSNNNWRIYGDIE